VLPSTFLRLDARSFAFDLFVSQKGIESDAKIAQRQQREYLEQMKRRRG
jgi:hypothetical protein